MKMAAATVRVKPPPPLDRGWAWMIVLGVFIYVFFMVGIAKSFGQLQLAFREFFDVPVAYAMMPMSLSAFVYAIGAPIAILVAELITPQRVVIIGAIIGLVGGSLCSLLFNMGYVVIMFGVSFGLGNSCFYGNGLVMIGKYFRKYKTLATGLALAGASIGQFAMPPLIEYLLETYGLSGTLLIIAACYSHAALSGALFRPIEQYGTEEMVVNVAEQKEEPQPLVEDKETLIKTSPGKDGEFLEAKTANSIAASDNSAAHVTNGNLVEKERDKLVYSENQKPSDKSDFTDDKPSLDNMSDTEMNKTEYLDEEERSVLERKVLLTSTGSVFLVSNSVHDVSDIDSRAHGLNTTEATNKKPSCVARIFDIRVMKSYITIFFTLVSFLCFFGYFNFILFLPGMIVDKGIKHYDMAMLISVCGAGDLIARIGTGFIADLNLIPRYLIKATACLLSGINIFVFIYANTFSWLAFHCFCYGFFGGTYVCLMSIVLVDFVGVSLLAKNLAFIMPIQGIGAALGQIFLGWLRDRTGTYSYVIFILALNMAAGGFLLYFYRWVRQWEEARLARINKSDRPKTKV